MRFFHSNNAHPLEGQAIWCEIGLDPTSAERLAWVAARLARLVDHVQPHVVDARIGDAIRTIEDVRAALPTGECRVIGAGKYTTVRLITKGDDEVVVHLNFLDGTVVSAECFWRFVEYYPGGADAESLAMMSELLLHRSLAATGKGGARFWEEIPEDEEQIRVSRLFRQLVGEAARQGRLDDLVETDLDQGIRTVRFGSLSISAWVAMTPNGKWLTLPAPRRVWRAES